MVKLLMFSTSESRFLFAPASLSEKIVFGAQRPGYPSELVEQSRIEEWLSFMKGQGIRRICCLLSEKQLEYYEMNLLDVYRSHFRMANVLWSPVEDYHLCDAGTLKERILPFLKEAEINRKPVVVHCSGGIGRTGHVLAAWLVHSHGYSSDEALTSVSEMGRVPFEAVASGNASAAELYKLLQVV